MKFFSRKALVAAATAAAVSFGGVSIASAETVEGESNTAVPGTVESENPEQTGTEEPSEPAEPSEPKKDDSSSDNGSSLKDADPKDIREWIGVFSAIIGALGTVFALVNKYFK